MDRGIGMFRYKLKVSDYISLIIIGAIIGIVYISKNTDIPYNWKWHIVWNYFIYTNEYGEWHFNLLSKGIFNTVRLFVYTTLLTVPLSLGLAFMRMSKNTVLSTVSMLYINFVRNVPVLVFLFVFYFFVSEQIFPLLGLSRDLFTDTGVSYLLFGDSVVATNLVAGFVCLGLFESVFFAEIIRGSIQSVPIGQSEGSYVLRLSKIHTLRFVILPQAFRKCYPALAGQTIIVLKNTSIVSIVSIQDLIFSGTEIVVATHRIFEVWITVGLIYFVFCYGLERLFNRWEYKGNI